MNLEHGMQQADSETVLAKLGRPAALALYIATAGHFGACDNRIIDRLVINYTVCQCHE